MKLVNRPSVHNFVIYWTVLSLVFLCISCSPKSSEDKKDEPTSSSIASKNQTQVSSEEEVRRLKQENAELKRAIDEVLPILEEVKRLKQENDELKRAIAESLTLIEEAKRLKQESDALKRAVAKAIGKKEQSGIYDKYRDKYKDKAAALVAEFESAISTEEKLEFIESLTDLSFEQDPSVIGVVQKALDDPDPEVGRAAIKLLEDYEIPEILPVVEQALDVKDEETRMEALTPLSGINDPQVAELLIRALGDTSKGVRSAALEVIDEHSDHLIKLTVMEKGITSPYDDVKYEVASLLEDRSDHSAVEILIEGLKDTDADFREEINETLDFLIEEEFETYEEARAWWIDNKDNYDDELFWIEEE